MKINKCQALVIAAPNSGSGKTSITSGLARYHRRQGKKVTVFKIGPDYIDPMIHRVATNQDVYNIDLWMMGIEEAKRLLFNASKTSDLILLEGVMGAFDGFSSSADVARVLGIPIVFVIDATAMASTFGAIAHGLRTFQGDLDVYGVLGNRVASKAHEEMVSDSLREEENFLGSIFRSDQHKISSRHLGLYQAEEIENLNEVLDALADSIGKTKLADIDGYVEFQETNIPVSESYLAYKIIAVAKDEAFSFIYQANIDILKDMGAKIIFFSPLHDKTLPICDAIWLPGGYPELHLDDLSKNRSMLEEIQKFVLEDGFLYAECGGMLYLMSTLTDKEGNTSNFSSVLDGNAEMQSKLSAVGMQWVEFPDGILKGHTFHHSLVQTDLTPYLTATNQRTDLPGEKLYKVNNCVASYFHAYFPSNQKVIAKLFGCSE